MYEHKEGVERQRGSFGIFFVFQEPSAVFIEREREKVGSTIGRLVGRVKFELYSAKRTTNNQEAFITEELTPVGLP